MIEILIYLGLCMFNTPSQIIRRLTFFDPKFDHSFYSKKIVQK